MYRVRKVMNTDLVTLRADATVADAIHTLVESGISGAPVVDHSGVLVGIVSEFQLLEAVYTPEFKSCRVHDIMTTDLVTVGENAFLSDAANLMMLHRIRRLPVVQNDRVVGIVARRDLLQYVIDAGESLDHFLQETTAIGCI